MENKCIMKEKNRLLLLAILSNYPYTFYAFGSRVTGKAREFSDLDLCFFDPIPDKVKFQLEEELEESDLPFAVDLVDWNKISEQFKKRIFSDLYYLQGDKNLKEKLVV